MHQADNENVDGEKVEVGNCILLLLPLKTAAWHQLHDSIRGAGNRLFSNDASATQYDAQSIKSFDSNGFTIGTSSDFTGDCVAWVWKGGGDDVLNEEGTIDSQVSANTEAGFSIVSYTGNGTAGATVGHGLDYPPEMVIVKQRNSVTGRNWDTYHTSIGASNVVFLNKTDASTAATSFNNTNPSSSVITLGNLASTNGTSQSNTYIAYCFHSVAGYSKIGSYSGTGIDGNAIYLDSNGDGTGTGGFQPSFILIKRTDSPDNWNIVDDKRGNNGLFPDVSSQELSNSGAVVFNTNGFTINGGAGGYNNSSGTYLYMAFK